MHILLRSSVRKWGERRGGFSEAHLQQPGDLAKALGSPERETAGGRTGQGLNTVPLSSESCFWSGFGSGQGCQLADSMHAFRIVAKSGLDLDRLQLCLILTA